MQQNKSNKNHNFTQEQLIEQAYSGKQFLDQSEQNLKLINFEFVYLIDKEWLYNWQDFVGYYDILDGQDPDPKTFSKKSPGPINKQIVMQKQHRYYQMKGQLEQEYDYFNQILDDKIKKRDVKKVDQECWNYFNSIYNGSEFKRPQIKRNGKIKYPCTFLRPYFILIDDHLTAKALSIADKDIKKDTNPFQIKRLQLQKHWKFQELKEFVYKFLQEQFKLTQIEIRFWIVDPTLNCSDVDEKLIKTIKQKKYKIKGTQLVESNFTKLYLNQFIKNTYNIFVEYKYSNVEEWLYNKSSVKLGPVDNSKGYCEYCDEEHHLNHTCICKQVFYCSRHCKYLDQRFHSFICEIAFDSEDDEQILSTEVTSQGKMGLKNIQNSCYMNASLQCLINTQDFSNFFLTNQFIKQRKNQEKQKNYLNQKLAKLIKYVRMAELKEIFPRALKNQIGIYDSNFRGSLQQDSQEFLNCLLESLNEEFLSQEILSQQQDYAKNQQQIQQNNNQQALLQLQNGEGLEDYQAQQQWDQISKQNFSQLISNCFLGLFKSTLSCPNCNYKNISYEPFSIIQLPIKQKPVLVTQHVYFVPFAIHKNMQQYYLDYESEFYTLQTFLNNCADIFNSQASHLLATLCNNDSITEYFFLPKSIQMTEITKKLNQGQSKNLVIYELDQETETYNNQNYKYIKLHFIQNAKQPGFKNCYEDSPISIPRIIFANNFEPLSTIYIQVFKIFSHYHKEALAFLQEQQLQQQIQIIEGDIQKIQQEEEEEKEKENFILNEKIEQIQQNKQQQSQQVKQEEQPQQQSDKKENKEEQKKTEQKNGSSQKSFHQPKQNNSMSGSKSNDSKQQQQEQQQQDQQQEQDQNNNEIYDNLPFKINVISDKKKVQKLLVCQICQSKTCKNCILKYDLNLTLNDYLKNYKGVFELFIYWAQNKSPPQQLLQHKLIKKSPAQIPPIVNEKELQQEQDQIKSKLERKIKSNKTNFTVLEECLQLFQEPEQLSIENAFNCPTCNQFQQAIKIQEIYYSPKFMVLQLKRFTTNSRGKRVKNYTKILYDQYLYMEELCNGVVPFLQNFDSNNNQNQQQQIQQQQQIKKKSAIKYELYSIVVHEGSIDQGHYYAYCKQENEWFKYNDNVVEISESKEVFDNKNAYILFYQFVEFQNIN